MKYWVRYFMPSADKADIRTIGEKNTGSKTDKNRTGSGLPSTAGTTASIAFVRRGKIFVG